METQEQPTDNKVSQFQPGVSGTSQEDYDAVVKDWNSLPPIVQMGDILQTCGVFLEDHPERDEVMSVLIVFTEQMGIWQDISVGKKPSLLEMETMVTGEGIVLDMTNDWFSRNKGMIDMSLMECRSAMTVVRLIRTISGTPPHNLDEELEIVWHQFVRSWEFIPWIMFVATGSVTLYSSLKVLMSRFSIDAKPNFIEDYVNLRYEK